jgi:hypothetical protein
MAQSLEESVIQKQLRDLQVTMFRVKVLVFQKIVMFSPLYGVHDIRNSK